MINARQGDAVDNYAGVLIPDPYRWMEDLDSDEVKQWVDSQNQITLDYLQTISAKATISDQLLKIFNYERYGIPSKQADRYFFTRNDGLQNQGVLYTLANLDDEPKVLLDPNTLSDDGTVALAGYSVSDDGKYLAYGLATSGSDWTTWRVRNIETAQDTEDELKWVKFSGASWDHNSLGFYYGRFDEPSPDAIMQDTNFYQKLYYHRLGTQQSADTLIFERPDQKEWMFQAEETDDGHYLLISVSRDTSPTNALYYKDLTTPGSGITQWLTKFDASYEYIGNDGTKFYFQSNREAPQGVILALDITKDENQTPKVIIPESKDTITSVSLFGEKLIVQALHDAHTNVKEYSLGGHYVRTLDLPGLGSAGGFGGKRTNTETFYVYTSFTSPPAIYHYDILAASSTIFRAPKVDFDSTDYSTRQIFYKSKDGTSVPMFITCRKDIKLDGSNPAILYGYGGFSASITPFFSPTVAIWLKMGGIYAVANIRGGGEYGETWHLSGTKENKQNVFDDFIAAAEYLIAEKYTSSPKLAINGGSNGGLLVGACLVQRPDLFGAAVPEVGVLDMLRYNKFTIGWAWVSDYGNPDDPDNFKYLLAYSPLHNLKPGTKYPATLVLTGDHDDRVVPAHSFKFTAALQAAQGGDAPTLIRVETKAGHGAGKPLTKIIDQQSEKLAFLTKALGMSIP
jgi:prolyl oligopeptidase